MLSGSGNPSPSSRPPRTSSARPDYNKPAPPMPSGGRHHDYGYGRGSGSSYDSRPPPGAYNDPRYDQGRPQAHSPRYDQQHPDPRYGGVGSPPPQDYGHGPPPQGYHGRPAVNRPPPTPAPPKDGNDKEALWRLFCAVDKDSISHSLFTSKWPSGNDVY
jgi:hypothetical protein